MTLGRDIALIAGLLCGAVAFVGVAGGLAGCSSETKPDLQSPVPSARIEAMGQAAERGEKDPKEIRELIALLDSDDPAVRVFAIATLERVTGKRLGYDAADPERLRKEATDRWQEWYGQEYGVGAADDRWKESGERGGGRTGEADGKKTGAAGQAGRGQGPAGHTP